MFWAFIVIPLVELYLLVWVGRFLGPGLTVGLVLATGVIGGFMARLEGLRVWRQWQRALAEGRMPEQGVLGGVLVLVGGILLITPGILTDLMGLLLLLPFTRALVLAWLQKATQRAVEQGTVRVVSHNRVHVESYPARSSSPKVIDTIGKTLSEKH